MDRKISLNIAVAITIIAMTVTFSISMIVSMGIFDNTVSSVTQKQAQFTKLTEIDNFVRANYYGEIDNEYLSDRTARGYIDGLSDRNGAYYTAAEVANMQQVRDGTRVGIGIEVSRDASGYYRVERVYADSPAARAGIQKGTMLASVDGVDTKTYTTARQVQAVLWGEQGTTVELGCIPQGETDAEIVLVQRGNFRAPTVETPRLVGNLAYIRISSFDTNSYADFDYALRTAVQDGAAGLVFDLRGNAGGGFDQNTQLEQVYRMLNLLCPRGTLAKSESKTGVVKVLATSDEEYVDLPMVVLVNGTTAGAAELFAANVRELAGGRLVGVRTAGRGMLQSVPQRLSDGSAVAITVAKLLTGSNASFDGTGLEPDVEVSVMEGEVNLYEPDLDTDNQIARGLEQLRILVGTSTVSSAPAEASSEEASVPEDSATDASADTSAGDGSDVSAEESSTSASAA